MADITCTATGKTFWRIPDDVACLLLEAFPASFERVNSRPQPTPQELEPQWSVCKNPFNDRLYWISFKQGRRSMTFDGPPSQVTAFFTTNGIVVSERILAEYRQLWMPRDGAPNAWIAEYNQIHNK